MTRKISLKTKLSPNAFNKLYLDLIKNKKIEDIHYYYHYSKGKNYKQLYKKLTKCTVWTVIMYGNLIDKTHKDLPNIFTHFPITWAQLFFIDDGKTVKIYRGNSAGSSYRFTHGIMANAFATLAKERKIKTFVLSQGKRGGLYIYVFDTLRLHGHELNGNYPISHQEVDRNISKKIRLYSSIVS